MTGSLTRGGLLISIPTWLAVALILGLLGDLRLSTTVFFVGGSLVSIIGLLLLSWDRASKIAIRPRVLSSSIILFSLGAALFAYWYFVVANIAFYIALSLMFLGTGEMLVGIKRVSSRSAGYSLARLRMWGVLIGTGTSISIVSVVLTSWGNPLLDWGVLVPLGFGLLAVSFLGLWMELKEGKP